MKKNSGFMLFETLIVSTLVLGTLVFLYVQLTNIKKSYNVSFKYNTIEGLYHANNIAKYLEKVGYQEMITNLADNTYLDITNCAYSTTLCSSLVTQENIKTMLFVNKDISTLKENISNIAVSKKFKRFIKTLPNYKKKYQYRLIVEFNDDTYASVGIGKDISELNAYTLFNLVSNSGFENGLNNWTTTNTNQASINQAFKKSGNNSLKFITSDNQEKTVNQTFQLIANHIYYADLYIYLNKAENGNINLHMNDNNYINTSFSTLKAKKWNNVSSLFTVETSGTYTFDIINSTGANTIYVDNILLIDLTKIFGAGSEPDFDWCSSNIKYFTTTSTIYK